MDDIVERLRRLAEEHYEMLDDVHLPMVEAADEITRLRAALSTARADALEEAAKVAIDAADSDPWDDQDYGWNYACSHLSLAIRALANPSSSEPSQ